MRLLFEGQAEASKFGVNFAGYWEDSMSNRHYVICRVTGEALNILIGGWGQLPDDLLAVYRLVEKDIHKLARAQFFATGTPPHITAGDIPRGWTNERRAA